MEDMRKLVQISFAEIYVRQGWNARLPPYSGIEDEQTPLPPDAAPGAKQEVRLGLLSLIINEGRLIEPLIVRPRDDRGFALVDGHRRHAALSLLFERHPELGDAFEHVPAIVEDLDEAEADLWNLNSSLARKQLTPFETAWKLHRMREEHNLTGAQLAAAVAGLSEAHANNLVRAIRRLHGLRPAAEGNRCPGCNAEVDAATDVLGAWRRGESVVSAKNAIQWAAYGHEDQVQLFRESQGHRTARRAAGTPAGRRERPGRVLLRHIEEQLKALPETPYTAGLRALHAFYTGRTRVLLDERGEPIYAVVPKARQRG